MQPGETIKILTTTAMIEDIAQRVGCERVDAMALIKGQLDPHSYQLVKGDDEKFHRADLIFFNGFGLEHGPSLQAELHHNPKAFPLAESIAIEPIYVGGTIDPHIWTDVSNWAKTVPVIVEALSKVDPDHAEMYQQNGEQVQRELETLHQTIQQQMAAISEKKRYLVSSHDAFNYFGRAYMGEDWEQRVQAPEGLAPESQLSVVDIQHIIAHLVKYSIEVIFPESNISADSLRKIVSAGTAYGLKIRIATEPLYGDAMGSAGSDGDSYEKMMSHNARIIRENLQ